MTDRFARHGLISDWRQNALARATTVVVGLGAVGNEAARILAMSGVGTLILCDHDRVEESNLSRTVLFRESDVGRLKVEAAAESLADLAPATAVVTRPSALVHGVGMAELRDASLVLSCLDTRAARLQLAGRCGLVAAPWIDGGTHAWGGEVRPYLDPGGPCYGCGLGAAERAVVDAPWGCREVIRSAPSGAAAPASALIGTWMATVALRFLMGLPCPGEVLRIDAANGTMVAVTQQRDLDCPLHSRVGEVTRVPVAAGDTLGTLRQAQPTPGTPLLWEPVICGVECPACGFREQRWGGTAAGQCPACGAELRTHTTLELDQAPEDLTLNTLGVAPREILAVRTRDGFEWLELETSTE